MRLSLKDRPLLSNIVSSAVYALLIAGGGFLLAYLKVAYPDWYSVVLAGLAGAALIAIILALFLLWKRLPKSVPPITTENVEKYIRTWLDSFRVAFKKIDDPQIVSQTIFVLHATLDNGMPVIIARPKILDRYITIEASIMIGPEDKPLFDRLSAEEQGIFAARLSVELSKGGAGFQMDLAQNRVSLQRRVPITDALTESEFMQAVDALDGARLLALRTLSLMLVDTKKQLAPQHGSSRKARSMKQE